ncbi:MAG: L-serine ammonia-lyase, iron-sulfur-dependent, subunit alpha [Clostridiales bacterium]|nr:L-serine ammonia-lyase, iron-sulfur-dependent, subunit alpha [Clostridiales bacterium]
MQEYTTISELLELAKQAGGLPQAVLEHYISEGANKKEAIKRMRENLSVMRASIQEGLNPDAKSMSGRVGGQSAKLMKSLLNGESFGGKPIGLASAYALAAAECNACMGRIVAAPTAGACGVLPAALFAAQDEKGYTDDDLVRALFVAAGVGRVIALRASISGAEGGCQAEVGSASAMAAAALAYLGGADPETCMRAAGFAIMNLMGLVCDPVEGLVEVPCVYRNVVGVSCAVTSANLAISGIPLIMSVDEIIEAMRRVGRSLPASLRETGEGGCAACKLCEEAKK